MKLWLVALVIMVLAACEPKPAFVPDGFRDTNIPITSSTRFNPKRFAGDWRVIESFEQTPREVAISRVTFRPEAGGYRYIPQAAISPLAADAEGAVWPVYRIGQFGRLSPEAGDPIWVIWVDEDHRTAALGTPSGRFGMIINRTENLRSDRLKAAREILAFNGYDITKLRKVSP
ncbi:apolipoprotein D and lipocalin family protein [Litoreibacter halocynthiae]|uniref:Apolipoprotein D and lipocalin family protein n=1 Tax=Litoreibacter halocynthiae TaxID=1242689 RepID=A0A4R7LHB5_9RHOB|nr:lipocalin family protein [Litoreibacter halocynthiae]TDT75157.1 apolipoprotein D and lipocalin family protein [Litoreibacter halocynthiae]